MLINGSYHSFLSFNVLVHDLSKGNLQSQPQVVISVVSGGGEGVPPIGTGWDGDFIRSSSDIIAYRLLNEVV